MGKLSAMSLRKCKKLYREDENPDAPVHGHITSISVLRPYRKLGIATKLMEAARI
jgi:peptide alpha-N-acetyltransferase